MSGKLMLIDQSYDLETRVAIVSGAILEDFDYEFSHSRLKKGNIYLAKVARIEPALQAVFIEYGEEKHGFLAFSEIHPSYYHTDKKLDPVVLEKTTEMVLDEDTEHPVHKAPSSVKVQDVMKRHQTLLVQVVKDVRGSKGAAFTTYISLPGKYSVLLPNTSKGTGISKKISSTEDRESLKKIVDSFRMSDTMSLLVRTAGLGKTKAEMKKDYDYLMRLWTDIEKKVISSEAPSLILEESDLLTRALRDMYSADIDEILIQGEGAYKKAKAFLRMFMPKSVKRISLYEKGNLFQAFGIEDQIGAIYSHCVSLPSGGAIIINPTEALVSIDVNSGRSTKEKHIDETALKTNKEAAVMIAKQLRLRDLSGLIVIDFIDMPSHKNAIIEKVLKEALKEDRARIQIGKISQFGLLEMSRQRLRQSLIESSSSSCPSCQGKGHVLSIYALALQCLHQLEKTMRTQRENNDTSCVVARGAPRIVTYLLNEKRSILAKMEEEYQCSLYLHTDPSLELEGFVIEEAKKASEPSLKGEEKKHSKKTSREPSKEVSKEVSKEESNDFKSPKSKPKNKPAKSAKEIKSLPHNIKPPKEESSSETVLETPSSLEEDILKELASVKKRRQRRGGKGRRKPEKDKAAEATSASVIPLAAEEQVIVMELPESSSKNQWWKKWSPK